MEPDRCLIVPCLGISLWEVSGDLTRLREDGHSWLLYIPFSIWFSIPDYSTNEKPENGTEQNPKPKP